jgi:hypothetical protein
VIVRSKHTDRGILMGIATNTVDGWAWYTANIRENAPEPEKLDYKALMQSYCRNEAWEEVVKRLDREALEILIAPDHANRVFYK